MYVSSYNQNATNRNQQKYLWFELSTAHRKDLEQSMKDHIHIFMKETSLWKMKCAYDIY